MARKHKVKVRVKVRRRIYKNAALAVSGLLTILLFSYGSISVVKYAGVLFQGKYFSFNIKKIEISAPTDEIRTEISGLLVSKTGARFSREDAGLFTSELKKRFPALSLVEVNRNFLSGVVSVRAVAELPVAQVSLDGSSAMCLAESGRLFTQCYGEAPVSSFETELHGFVKGRLTAIAVFLKDLRVALPAFSVKFAKLECRSTEQSCIMRLATGDEVVWGALDFTKDKIARLNEILPDAAGKLGGPLKIDLRYFRDGKVFVSKMPRI